MWQKKRTSVVPPRRGAGTANATRGAHGAKHPKKTQSWLVRAFACPAPCPPMTRNPPGGLCAIGVRMADFSIFQKGRKGSKFLFVVCCVLVWELLFNGEKPQSLLENAARWFIMEQTNQKPRRAK